MSKMNIKQMMKIIDKANKKNKSKYKLFQTHRFLMYKGKSYIEIDFQCRVAEEFEEKHPELNGIVEDWDKKYDKEWKKFATEAECKLRILTSKEQVELEMLIRATPY